MNAVAAYDNSLASQPPGPGMGGPFVASFIFHICIIILGTLGLPYVVREPMTFSSPISVEIVEIDELTQTNRVARPAPPREEPAEPTPPQQAKPQPPK